jgi:ABC-type amino acid transport/signal transduction systems, periplasmic component/domain
MVLLRRLATAISLLGAVILAGCAGDGSDVQSQKMATIKARGSLLCGTDGKLPGFSYVGSDGRYAGLDVDTCRAVAAAMLGDGEKVQFRA